MEARVGVAEESSVRDAGTAGQVRDSCFVVSSHAFSRRRTDKAAAELYTNECYSWPKSTTALHRKG
jgi:hypothetical protein